MRTNNYKLIQEQLNTLKLNGIANTLDDITEKAGKKAVSHLGFLKQLLSEEVTWRNNRRLKRNLTSAHFPATKRIEDYNCGKIEGFSKADVANLKDLRWLDNFENILFFGPPGIGKTHLAISCGLLAIEAGYTVCFEKVVNLFRLLKTADLQRRANFRLKKLMKADLLIIDEIGYTPIERREANLFFNRNRSAREENFEPTQRQSAGAWEQ
ncbi:MAG: ATP-binding protein [Thermodesulfobacteriota bacterium]|nr:ATP-binding protein [Thermodesulfobacteriota bacterium]